MATRVKSAIELQEAALLRRGAVRPLAKDRHPETLNTLELICYVPTATQVAWQNTWAAALCAPLDEGTEEYDVCFAANAVEQGQPLYDVNGVVQARIVRMPVSVRQSVRLKAATRFYCDHPVNDAALDAKIMQDGLSRLDPKELP